MQNHTPAAGGFMRQRDIVPAICPVSPSTLWRWVAAGTFPKPVKLSERVTAWRCDDVADWVERQRASGDKAAA